MPKCLTDEREVDIACDQRMWLLGRQTITLGGTVIAADPAGQSNAANNRSPTDSTPQQNVGSVAFWRIAASV